MIRDDIGTHEMLNGWYWHTREVKRVSTDDIHIQEMLNGWYWHKQEVKRTSQDDIDIHEMLNGRDEMILTYMRC